jgi:hypothetical protein
LEIFSRSAGLCSGLMIALAGQVGREDHMALDTQQKSADGRGSDEFRELIDANIKTYADVVRAANLKFD